ncbi:putative zinc finger CCHC-type and RNA-binding motif-containing protein 1-like [Capsicum annuum]|nr:putative zinc finger CCHC-type and RNA-binding motif-containing protein 1-like [Capsicum annuum]
MQAKSSCSSIHKRTRKKKKKKKSNSNTKTAAVIISNGQENFNHISKGKNVVEPSNDNTDQMDVDQVSDILDRDNFTILLWNPSTIESVVLLRIECPPGSLSRFGLGYDSINGTDIFKIWALKEYGVKGSWMLLLTVEEPDLSLNAKPTYLFADGEVLFRCMSYQHIVHTFRTLNGPFRSWPICDTMQGGSAFTESLISPKSLTY